MYPTFLLNDQKPSMIFFILLLFLSSMKYLNIKKVGIISFDFSPFLFGQLYHVNPFVCMENCCDKPTKCAGWVQTVDLLTFELTVPGLGC